MSVLFDNAARYAHSRFQVECAVAGESLWVRCRNDRAPDSRQLSALERENLFEAFQRGPAADRVEVEQEESGWGLGLAIARKIARRAGGELSLEQVGDEVEFALRLPIVV